MLRLPLVITGTALLSIAALALMAFGVTTGSASFTEVHIVYVNDTDFCGTAGDISCPEPYAIDIDPGEHVVFRDGGNGPAHSVTECTNGSFTNCGTTGFSSGIKNLPPGEDYFPTALTLSNGTHYYRCQVHGSSMAGVVQVGEVTTPTASPLPTPTIAPTPTPSPSPTIIFEPTPPTSGPRGDLDCDGDVDAHDLEELLAHFAGVGGHGGHHGFTTSGSDCPIPGTILPDHRVGELNCDNAVTIKDSMVLLYHLAGLELDLPDGCRGVN